MTGLVSALKINRLPSSCRIVLSGAVVIMQIQRYMTCKLASGDIHVWGLGIRDERLVFWSLEFNGFSDATLSNPCLGELV